MKTPGALHPEQRPSVPRRWNGQRTPTWLWAAIAVVASIVPVRGVLSGSEIFYLRDLGSEYWPIHLWLTRTVCAGESPFWDPYVACGQSAVADPTRQILF